eukprot:XP_011669755.1 PREDICTED: uncharacterized protein LOC105440872 [Strongylocentrotus purpuratus]
MERGDVVRISGPHFKVTSETALPGSHYNVHLHKENNMPSCECWNWRWTHLPCKHILAVLQHSEAKWVDLPEAYRESPLFTLDPDVPVFLQTQPQVMVERVEDEEDLAEYDDLPMEKQFSLKKAVAIKCREHLAILRDLTYVCTDIEVLNSMEDKLGLLVMTTKLRMQDEVGLIGDAAVSGPSKRKRKRPHQCGESKSLPERKRKQSVSVGAAADQKRQNLKLITASNKHKDNRVQRAISLP